VLNYLGPVAGRPRTYTYDLPGGEPRSTAMPEQHEVPIHKLRPIAKEVSLDEHGFGVVRHRSAVPGYEHKADIRAVIYPEATRLLLEVTSADCIVTLFGSQASLAANGVRATSG